MGKIKQKKMTNNLTLLFKKYSVPAIFLILGLLVLYVGLTSKQGTVFILSAVMMFIAGAMSVAFSSGKFKRGIMIVFGVLAGVAAIVIFATSWKSVAGTKKHQRSYNFMVAEAQQNLSDVRYIQKTHFEQKGTYLKTWDELIDYANNGTVDQVEALGIVPSRALTRPEEVFLYNENRPLDNNITEIEAYRLSKWKEGPNYVRDFKGFKRDTNSVPILDYKFKTPSYIESREKIGLGDFNASLLPFVPDTDKKEKWNLEIKDDVIVGEDTVSVIKVSGKLPYTFIEGEPESRREEMYFGSLTSNNLGGSWEE